jgi:hypothetical protein
MAAGWRKATALEDLAALTDFHERYNGAPFGRGAFPTSTRRVGLPVAVQRVADADDFGHIATGTMGICC